VVTTLADMEGNEAFDPSSLGQADEVVESRVGDGEMIYIKVRGGGGGADGFSPHLTLTLMGAALC
jgi:hypothetical protein